jgi:hypothetical protein
MSDNEEQNAVRKLGDTILDYGQEKTETDTNSSPPKSSSSGRESTISTDLDPEGIVNEFLSRFGLSREKYDETSEPFPGIEARFITLESPHAHYYSENIHPRYSIDISLATQEDRQDPYYFVRNLSVWLDNSKDGKFVATLERTIPLPPEHILLKMLPRIREFLKIISTEMGITFIDQVFESQELAKWKVRDILQETFLAAMNETGMNKEESGLYFDGNFNDLLAISWADIKAYGDLRKQILTHFRYFRPGIMAKQFTFLQKWAIKLAERGIIPKTAMPSENDIMTDKRFVKDDRNKRARPRLQKIMKRRQEEKERQVLEQKRKEIIRFIDEINVVAGEETFDLAEKNAIAHKVASWGLESGKSVLVAGHAGEDYLPVLLDKMGLKVSVIDIDAKAVKNQNALHRKFGLDKKIDSFISYEDLHNRKFDYITAFAVINIVAPMVTDDGEMATMSTQAEKVAMFIKPILALLNPDGGHIFINSPGAAGTEKARILNDAIFVLDQLLPYLTVTFGFRLVPQPQIDITDFTMHPTWSNEGRYGFAYRSEKVPAEPNPTSPKTSSSGLVSGMIKDMEDPVARSTAIPVTTPSTATPIHKLSPIAITAIKSAA